MNISISMKDYSFWKNIFEKVSLLDILFYLVVLTFYIGKAFKPAVFLVDLVFFIQVYKNRDFWERVQEYRPFIWAMIFFMVYLLFQGLFVVEYKKEVLRSTLEEIMYMIMVVAAIYHFRSYDQLRKLIYVTWFIVALVSLDALYQYVQGEDIFGYKITPYGHRLTAWKEGKSALGPILGFLSGILFVAPFLFKDKKLKIAAWLVALTLLVVIVLAGNRSPILALFSAFIVVLFISKYRKYLFAILLVFVLAFFLVMKTNHHLTSKYEALFHPTSNSATANRYHIFLTALELIREYPIFGIGPGAYDKYHLEATKKVDWSRYKKYQVAEYMHHAPAHAHSVFLDMILSYGFVGFGFLLYMFYQFFQKFIMRHEYTKIAALGFFYCITPLAFSQAFTVGTWQYMTYLSMVFVVAVAKAMSKSSIERSFG